MRFLPSTTVSSPTLLPLTATSRSSDVLLIVVDPTTVIVVMVGVALGVHLGLWAAKRTVRLLARQWSKQSSQVDNLLHYTSKQLNDLKRSIEYVEHHPTWQPPPSWVTEQSRSTTFPPQGRTHHQDAIFLPRYDYEVAERLLAQVLEDPGEEEGTTKG